MNKMVLTLAIVTSMVSCTKDDTMNENEYQNSVNKETFGKKEWKSKSINSPFFNTKFSVRVVDVI